MTEAEAIKVLEKEKAYMDSHGGDTQSEALSMAINALEKQIAIPHHHIKIDKIKDCHIRLSICPKCLYGT